MSKRLERFPEKRVELKEDGESLHKSKHDRRVEINKIEEESGGFKPQAFKSSRSSRFDSSTKSKEVQLPSAQPNQTNKTAETSNNPAVSQQEIQKSLMHPSVITFSVILFFRFLNLLTNYFSRQSSFSKMPR